MRVDFWAGAQRHPSKGNSTKTRIETDVVAKRHAAPRHGFSFAIVLTPALGGRTVVMRVARRACVAYGQFASMRRRGSHTEKR